MKLKSLSVNGVCTFLFAAICLASLPASAKDYYISKQNGGYRDGSSVDKACYRPVWFFTNFNRLKPGDNVYFGPGTYGTPGYFVIGYMNRSRTSGSRGARIRLIADPECKHLTKDKPGPVVLNGPAYQTVSFEGVNYVTLDGFKIANRTVGGTGVAVRGSHGNIIRNCEFINPPGRSNLLSVGISVLSADCLIQNCTFNDLSSMGVYCRDNSRTTIEDCKFSKIGLRGVGCWQRGTSVTVRRSQFFDNQEAIYLDPQRGGTVENCWITGSKRDGIINSTGNAAIRHCTINNNRGHGIRLQSSFQKIRNTLTVENCLIANNGGIGLNHVARTKYGDTTSRLYHRNNLFWKNKGGDFTSIVAKDKTEIVADPKLKLSAGKPDLLDDSPAINAGRVLRWIRTDMVMQPRPAVGGADIGAIEGDASKRSKVYYVMRNGKDSNSGDTPDKAWRNPYYAFRKLYPGDTLYIGPGKYRSGSYANLLGTADQPITIIGDVTGSKTGRAGAVVLESSSYYNLYVRGGHVEINGIEFRTTGRYNLYLYAEYPIAVRNCRLIGGSLRSILAVGGVTVDRCYLKSRYGIAYENAFSWDNPHFKLIQSKLDCTTYSLFAWDHSRINRAPRGSPATVLVDRCMIRSKYGPNMSGVKAIMTNNLLTGATFGFSYRGTLPGSGCWNNTIIGQEGSGWGIFLRRWGHATVANNIIVDFEHGMYCSGREFIATQRSNLLFSNLKDVLLIGGFKMNQEVLKGDPLFVDASNNNFQLTADSPAVDAGIETEFDVDLAGRKRPFGKGFDLGCYESEFEAGGSGADKPVPSLWGVNSLDGTLFKVGNYYQPAQTLVKYGQLRNVSGVVLENVEAMAVDRAAVAYFVYDARLASGWKGPVLGRLKMNDLPSQNGAKASPSTNPLIVQVIGAIKGAGEITGIAIDPTDKMMYAISPNLRLYAVNKATGEIESSKRLRFPSSYPDSDAQVIRVRPRPEDLIFDAQGNLFVVDANYLMYLVNKKTGDVLKIAKKSDATMRFTGLAFDHLNGRLVGSNSADGGLYQLKIKSGAGRKLGPLGMSRAEAIAFVPGEGVKGKRLRIVEWKEMSGRKK